MNELIINQNQGFERSNRYAPVSTKTVLETLKAEGYEVNNFSAAKVRKSSKNGFQKHLLRISRNDLDLNIEGLRPEIILINSHDGSTGFKLLVGVFRFACANGLIVGSSYFERNIRHVGDVMPKVFNAMSEVQTALPMIAQDIKRFSQRQMTQVEKEIFAQNVVNAIVPKDVKGLETSSLLTVVRDADKGNDLFTVLNVVQENFLKGNLKLVRQNGEVTTIRKMRQVKSLSRSTEINQAVWDIASQVAA